MELKEPPLSSLLARSYRAPNPFNGIERGGAYCYDLRRGVKVWGIHSMELKELGRVLFHELGRGENPFNGIESWNLHFQDTYTCAHESIQWN